MDAKLDFVVAALANLSGTELHAPIDATCNSPRTAPGPLAWLDHACDLEQQRRQGHELRLQPPDAAIDPSEDAVSIAAAIARRATFAHADLPGAGAVLALFDAFVELLTGGARKHWRWNPTARTRARSDCFGRG